MGWLISAVVLLVGLESSGQGTQGSVPTTLVIYAVDPVAGTAVSPNVPTPRYDLNWITGRSDAPESRIVLRPMARRALDLEFRNADGTPASVKLWAIGTGCGAAGLLGTSDANGRLSVADFYPEEITHLYVGENGNWRWDLDPRKEQWRGRRVITLK